jgi:predicted phage baseplate assembly protein
MPLPLPDLDTRRFADLTDEARAAVPRYAPSWTDHNFSDPGITLLELTSAQTDELMYRLNRITDRDRATLLRLLGFVQTAPIAASGVAAFALNLGAAARTLPAGLRLSAQDPWGKEVDLALSESVRVGICQLAEVRVFDGYVMQDVTHQLASHQSVEALGADPDATRQPALYVGLDVAPEIGEDLHLSLAVPTSLSLRAWSGTTVAADDPTTAWEWFDGSQWQALTAADETDALRRSGRVTLPITQLIPQTVPIQGLQTRSWLRCRLVRGRHDAVPMLAGMTLHSARVLQATHATSRLQFDPTLVIPAGHAPVPGISGPIAIDTGSDGMVTALTMGAPLTTPAIGVFEAGLHGALVGCEIVGRGERRPHQVFTLHAAPVIADSVAAWIARPTAAGLVAESLTFLASLDAAGPHELVALLNPVTGAITVGDGRHGRMLRPDELVVATFARTKAEAGNLPTAAPCRIDVDPDGPNDFLLGAPAGGTANDVAVTLPWGVANGAAQEDLAQTAARAARRLSAHEQLIELLETYSAISLDEIDHATVVSTEVPERALTAADLERIVLETPGQRVARVRVFPELDADLPELRAAGTATVVVLPSLPAASPEPTGSLLRSVRATIEEHRIVGSRIVVVGPTYVEVSVRATLAVNAGSDVATTLSSVRRRINQFLHPLSGGKSGHGWPFGRDVYRADLLALIDGVQGVAHVVTLELLNESGEPTCGNFCVPPTALIRSGSHDVQEAR